VSYTTPTIHNFNASVYYSANAEATAPGFAPKDKVWDLTLRYFRGPINLQYDWVQRYDIVSPLTGQSVAGRDNFAHKLGAAYTYAPGSQVSFIWTKIGVHNAGTFTNAAGSSQAIGSAIWNFGDNLSAQSWNLEWEHTVGNIQGFAGYGLLKSVKGSTNAAGMPDTGAKTYYLGARYNFSKRTGIYINYIQMSNEANQFVDLAASGMSSAIATGTNGAGVPYVLPNGSPLTGGGTLGPASAGADPRAIGIGFQHNF
jgi:predicted porin